MRLASLEENESPSPEDMLLDDLLPPDDDASSPPDGESNGGTSPEKDDEPDDDDASSAKKSSEQEDDEPEEPACCGVGRVHLRADYLGWWMDGMAVPPLITTSPNGTLQNQAGVLGQPGTSILFGDTHLNSDARSGGRFSLGLWLDPCGCRELEATYLALSTEAASFEASNADFAILARPYFNVQNGDQEARLIAFPGVFEGAVFATAETEFESGELLLRHAAVRQGYTSIDYLLGWRWTQLNDSLAVDEFRVSTGGVPIGDTVELFDQFDTWNTFHGAEFGVSLHRSIKPCWSLRLVGKAAIGNTNSVVEIAGETITTDAAGGTTTSAGGLLAQPTNIGGYERNRFGAVVEAGVTLRRRLACGLHATVGYSFIYWTDVVRAGDQIDFGVNPSQIPPGVLIGDPRPAFALRDTDFWAQGLHLGLEYTF